MKKKILVTGGAGFIARNLFEQLKTEYSVLAINRKELDLLDSLKVFDYLRRNQYDVIIHTATYDAAPKHSTKDPAKVLQNNLRMFFNIARCEGCFTKMIYFGSGAEFSREHWIPKMKEDYFDQHVPLDQYGFSKYIMTKYAQLSGNVYNLRLFGVFGKYDDWRTRFISSACCQAVLGQPLSFNQNRLFDHLYIDDLARIVKWFIHHKPQHNVYNVCSGEVYDFRALAEKIIKMSGKDLEIIMENEGLVREYSGNNSLLLGELRDFVFTPIDESLKSLYDWHDLNKSIFSLKV